MRSCEDGPRPEQGLDLVKIRVALASSNTPADRDELITFIDGLEKRQFDTVWLSDTPHDARGRTAAGAGHRLRSDRTR